MVGKAANKNTNNWNELQRSVVRRPGMQFRPKLL